ncbi:hypothetical protein [Halomonas salipaludis]|uniref:Uncharacterized protein n=1 Tax=Halomonas salipaludis TaxID=2032625 RepID=A0A2A2ERC6_9GAMM|nr:hypothetical protein [Halomonas salipaludis]PAU75208.1 hypothetical protein CK498_18860 [Halomonas salipaludis]
MPNSRDPRDNPAWQAAQQWRERARQGRPSGLRLFFTWLLFGTLMIVGTVIGLFFLLIGWAMLPFLRHRMKKRMERMRAEQAQDIGSGQGNRHHHQQVLEGDYEIKDESNPRRPD